MELNEAFRKSLLALIKARVGGEPQEIIDYDSETRGSGGCETCYFEWAVVVVKYRDADGSVKSYEYNSDFMDLVNDLLSFKV